jgi:hypothetical protein
MNTNIAPLAPGGDSRDGRDIAKINEIIDFLNSLFFKSSQDQLLQIKAEGQTINFSLQGLKDKLAAVNINLD